MGIPINGITKADVDGCNTEASSGLKQFPFVTGEWTNHTAIVEEVCIQEDKSPNGNDRLVVKGRNGDYGCQISVQLDPTALFFVNNNMSQSDIEKQIQKNKDKLIKVAKSLDLFIYKNNIPEIEPKRFDLAKGKIFSFGVMGQKDAYGTQALNDKGYAKTYIYFNGIVAELTPVEVSDDVYKKYNASQSYSNNDQIKYLNNDIPF